MEYTLDQSTDLAERIYHCVDELIKALETAKSVENHYVAMGGVEALSLYFQNAPPAGPKQAEMVSGMVSLIATLQFVVDNNHVTNFYSIKSKGSSPR